MMTPKESTSLMVIGTIGLDTIDTPYGFAKNLLGGSAIYFALAASHRAKVTLLGAIGKDFPLNYVLAIRNANNINLSLKKSKSQKSFSWVGKYGLNAEIERTMKLALNVYRDYRPSLSSEQRQMKNVFLANMSPKIQLHCLKQLTRPDLIACDSLDHWIHHELRQLEQVFHAVDIVFLNWQEVSLLTGIKNPIKAAQRILKIGPKIVIVKCGSKGSYAVTHGYSVKQPCKPMNCVIDSTGAGDAFAGGVLSVLIHARKINKRTMMNALQVGASVAFQTILSFGPYALFNYTTQRGNGNIKLC